jgi:hypothetical protein
MRCCVAQWLRQFSGHTHATKVEDAEAGLRNAVAVFRAANAGDRGRKAKSLRSLAEGLLSARLKLLKARIAALDPVAEGREENADGIEALRAREAETRADGVDGILAEFGALDALA